MKAIYADYAAATPTDPRVIARITEVAKQFSGNPSSRHSFGQAAESELTIARGQIAQFLNAKETEIYFTGSGTESNNLAILGIARANRKIGNHIITTTIEHPSVLGACQALERDGFSVTYLPVDRNGQVSIKDFQAAITPKTILATIHSANSEIGVTQPVTELAKIASERKVLFHTDACQAANYLPLDVQVPGIDALTLNGSKLYGPRGTAVLFVRDGVSIFPLVYGGGQEQSLRSGTENLPGIAGLALAVQIAEQQRDRNSVRIGKLRDQLEEALIKTGSQVNAASGQRLPNHLSVIIPTQETDLVAALNREGIAVSSGSACSSRSQTDSHVLQAIGLTSDQTNKTIRISLGRGTTAEEIKKIVKAVQAIV